jgi:hypothetical protein
MKLHLKTDWQWGHCVDLSDIAQLLKLDLSPIACLVYMQIFLEHRDGLRFSDPTFPDLAYLTKYSLLTPVLSCQPGELCKARFGFDGNLTVDEFRKAIEELVERGMLIEAVWEQAHVWLEKHTPSGIVREVVGPEDFHGAKSIERRKTGRMETICKITFPYPTALQIEAYAKQRDAREAEAQAKRQAERKIEREKRLARAKRKAAAASLPSASAASHRP